LKNIERINLSVNVEAKPKPAPRYKFILPLYAPKSAYFGRKYLLNRKSYKNALKIGYAAQSYIILIYAFPN
jgi:hypothetical protein